MNFKQTLAISFFLTAFFLPYSSGNISGGLPGIDNLKNLTGLTGVNGWAGLANKTGLSDLLGKTSSLFNNTINSLSDLKKIVAHSTTSFWQSLTSIDILKLGKDKIQKILGLQPPQIPQRITKELQRLLLLNLTEPEIVDKLSSNTITLGGIQTLIQEMPKPDEWSVDDVDFFGSHILKLPGNFLLSMTDNPSLMSLFDTVDEAVTSDSANKNRWTTLRNELLRKIYGPVETWTDSTFDNISLDTIPADFAARLSPQLIASREQEIINYIPQVRDLDLRRTYLVKIFQNAQLNSSSNLTTVESLISNTTLGKFVMPEDLNNSILSNPAIKSMLTTNYHAAIAERSLSPKGALLIALDLNNISSITTDIVNAKGKDIIGVGTPGFLMRTCQNITFSSADIISMMNGVSSSKGPGTLSKLKTLANETESFTCIQTGPVYSVYPSDLIAKISPKCLNHVSESEAKTLLSTAKNIGFDDTQMQTLLLKIKSGFKDLSAKARASITSANLQNIPATDLVAIAKGLPADVPVAMLAAQSTFNNTKSIMPSDVTAHMSVLPFIGAKKAKKFNSSKIFESLQNMKDVNPSLSACITLKDKLINYSIANLGVKNEADLVKHLLVTDMENIPVCVLLALGPKNLQNLGSDQMVVLLQRLGRQTSFEWTTMKAARMTVVQNGLSAMRSGAGLQPGDLETVGLVIADIPASMLSSASNIIVPDVVESFKSLIMRNQKKPCLSSDQRSALGAMVKMVKGMNPSQWQTVTDVFCLLYTLPESDLRAIPKNVIILGSCPSAPPMARADTTVEALCKAYLQSDYGGTATAEKLLMSIQAAAAADALKNITNTMPAKRRRKRQATSSDSSLCDQASYAGADGLTAAQLQSMTPAGVLSCLNFLGAYDMQPSNAQILAGQVKMAMNNSLHNMTATTTQTLGFIVKGFSPNDLANFPSFTYRVFDNVVAMLGHKRVLSTAQVVQLVTNVKQNWKTPSQLIASDISFVNQLMCGFNATDISAMNPTEFKKAISTISQLQGCPLNTVLTPLSQMCVSVFGNISLWTESQVSEMGACVSGLPPEQIAKINESAIEGLTPLAMQQLPVDSLKAMTVSQLTSLGPATASSLTQQQLNSLPPGMQSTLTSVMSGLYGGSGAASLVINFVLLSCLMMLHQLHQHPHQQMFMNI